MIIRTVLPSILALSIFLLGSCGSPYRYIKTRSLTEAELLKSDLSARKFSGEDMQSADTMLEKAQQLASEGKDKKAASYAEMAAAHYRLALVRHELSISKVDLNKADIALKKARQQVGDYQKILEDIRESRRP
ncbi:MAG: hypothetical protein ACLFQB_12490 [Chitinispirillaceae bacterium]